MNNINFNEWTFSGTVVYLRLLDKDFGASMRLKCDESNVEIGCLLTKDVWKIAEKKCVKLGSVITLSGRMENFPNGTSKTPKTMFIAECVMEVG